MRNRPVMGGSLPTRRNKVGRLSKCYGKMPYFVKRCGMLRVMPSKNMHWWGLSAQAAPRVFQFSRIGQAKDG